MTKTAMTYARARLWLGICGVGSLVTISTVALVMGLPSRLLSQSTSFGTTDLIQLSFLALLFIAWLAPFDFLGGYRLPKRFFKIRRIFWALAFKLFSGGGWAIAVVHCLRVVDFGFR